MTPFVALIFVDAILVAIQGPYVSKEHCLLFHPTADTYCVPSAPKIAVIKPRKTWPAPSPGQ